MRTKEVVWRGGKERGKEVEGKKEVGGVDRFSWNVCYRCVLCRVAIRMYIEKKVGISIYESSSGTEGKKKALHLKKKRKR